jgi:hypothetical protein
MSLSMSRSSEAMRARPWMPALRSRVSRALLASCGKGRKARQGKAEQGRAGWAEGWGDSAAGAVRGLQGVLAAAVLILSATSLPANLPASPQPAGAHPPPAASSAGSPAPARPPQPTPSTQLNTTMSLQTQTCLCLAATHLQLLLQAIQLQVELLDLLLARLLRGSGQRQRHRRVAPRLPGRAVQAAPQALGPHGACGEADRCRERVPAAALSLGCRH